MPEAIAIIASLIGAGTEVAGLFNRPSPPKLPTQPTQPIGPTPEQQKALLAPQFPDIQALTGGSLSPDYYASVAPVRAGIAGTPGIEKVIRELLASFFGAGGTEGGGGGASFSPAGLGTNLSALATQPGTSDFLQKVAASLG